MSDRVPIKVLYYPLFLLSLLAIEACQKEKLAAPPFEKVYGENGDSYASAAVAIGTSIYMLGTNCCAETHQSMQLLKINENGDLLLDKSYHTGRNCTGFNIKASMDGDLFLLGITEEVTSAIADIYLLKVNQAGDILWEKTIGNPSVFDLATGLTATADGGLLLLGGWRDTVSSFRDLRIIRMDENGDTLWAKVFNTPFDDDGVEVVSADDGGFWLLGRRRNGDDDFLLMKIDAQGNSLWTKEYGGADYEVAYDLCETQEGGLLLCGHSASSDPLHDLYAVRIDAVGDILWEKHYGGSAHDGGVAAAALIDGTFLLVGETDSYGNGSKRMLVVHLDASGNLLKMESIGGNLSDKANAVVAFPTAYYIIGESASFSTDGSKYFYVVKQTW